MGPGLVPEKSSGDLCHSRLQRSGSSRSQCERCASPQERAIANAPRSSLDNSPYSPELLSDRKIDKVSLPSWGRVMVCGARSTIDLAPASYWTAAGLRHSRRPFSFAEFLRFILSPALTLSRRVILCAGHFLRSIPALSGAAAHRQIHSSVVWRRARSLDDLHAFFPVAAAGRLRLCPFHFALAATALASHS